MDFGQQPILNRFEPVPLSENAFFPLRLGQCKSCGLLQLTDTVPAAAIRPRKAMIYREPERHLDAVVKDIARLSDAREETRIFGLTYKDDSTLERLDKAGYGRTWRPSIQDLGIDEPFANIETVQTVLDPDSCQRIVDEKGTANLIIARHILEHCNEPRKFLDGMTVLLAKQGLLVIEVPDCSKSLRLNDYTMLWEEHVAYFIPDTLSGLLRAAGFEIIHNENFSYPFEDVTVVVARASTPETADTRADLFQSAESYAAHFTPFGEELNRWFKVQHEQGARFCGFGAGHLMATFINLHQVEKYFDFIIDDVDGKIGNLLPGTNLLIKPSEALNGGWNGTCLMGLSPDAESRIIAKFETFTRNGGAFHSILADSPSSIYPSITQ